MSSRPDPHAPSTPADHDDHAARAAPVNPGAWDTRSWTLVDETDDPPAQPGPEPPGGAPDPGEAAHVVWPEASRADAPALDADGVPLAEPPTGPLRSVPGAAEASAPGPLRSRLSPGGSAVSDPGVGRALDANDVPLAEPPTGPLPRPASPAGASAPGPLRGRRVRSRKGKPEPEGRPDTVAADATGDPSAEPLPRRRASATPRTAPRPAPPDPETRLPGPAAEPRTPAPEREAVNDRNPGERRGRGTGNARRRPDATRRETSASGERRAAVPASRLPFGERAPGEDREPSPEGRPARAGRAAAATAAPGAGSADPVRELMHRHRTLCERAVDPLEIAAGLEAHGITDRTAARYRHRDVFSLAEELYVRVPRAEAGADGEREAAGTRPAGVLRTTGRGLTHLLPGALCAAVLVGVQYVPQTPPYARPAVGALGALTVLAAVRLSLRGVPRTRTAGLWACWLLGYVLYGDWLLTRLLAGGARADHLLPALGCLCVPLAMSFGVAPAAWCAHLFAARARRRLSGSRSLGDFAAGVRPLLLLTVALFAAALLAVQAAAHTVVAGAAPPHATQAATAALGVLLFVALLLSAHGFPRAASAGLAAACLMVAAALGTVLAARLPGAERLAQPVEDAVAAWGPTVVPIAACALAALPLLGYALRVLTGASAHQRGAAPAGRRPRQAR